MVATVKHSWLNIDSFVLVILQDVVERQIKMPRRPSVWDEVSSNDDGGGIRQCVAPFHVMHVAVCVCVCFCEDEESMHIEGDSVSRPVS